MALKWRLARSLEQLRHQVNVKWPKRSKASDGSIGDASHASRSSDHNPHIDDGAGPNVVSAIDITHDPRGGLDSYVLAESLRASRDDRIKYIISRGRIVSGSDGPQPWVWRTYSGKNPHNHHVHISVKASKAHYDSVKPWGAVDGVEDMPDETAPEIPRTLRKGDKGADVAKLQRLVGLTADGDFGQLTDQAVRLIQIKHGLVVDGICGPATWEKILAASSEK